MPQTQFPISKTNHHPDIGHAIDSINQPDSCIVRKIKLSQQANFSSLRQSLEFLSLEKEDFKKPLKPTELEITSQIKIRQKEDIQKKQTLITALILNKNFLAAESEISFLTEHPVTDFIKINKIAPKAFTRNDSEVIKYLTAYMKQTEAPLSDWIFLASIATECSPFPFVYQPIWCLCKEFALKKTKNIETELQDGLEKYDFWRKNFSTSSEMNKTIELFVQHFPTIRSKFIDSLTIQNAIEKAQDTDLSLELIKSLKNNPQSLSIIDSLTQTPLKTLLFDKAIETMNLNLALFLLDFGNFSTSELTQLKNNPLLKDSQDPIALQILSIIHSKTFKYTQISLLFCAALQELSTLARKCI